MTLRTDYPARDAYWPSSSGPLHVGVMETRHLENALRFCERCLELGTYEDANDARWLKSWIATFNTETQRRSNSTNQEKETVMEIDNVTLVQMARGTKLYAAFFEEGGQYYHFKSNADLYRGQCILVEARGKIAVAEVSHEAPEDFELAPGVTYTWALGIVDPKLTSPNKQDKKIRHQLRWGQAAKQVEEAMAAAGITNAQLNGPAPDIEDAVIEE